MLTDLQKAIQDVLAEEEEGTPPPTNSKKPKKPNGSYKYPHGNYLRYFSEGCRCDECRRAGTAYSFKNRHKRQASISKDEIPHGTPNGYKNLGCRCDECRIAVRANQRQYKESDEAKRKRNERKREKRRKEKENRLTGVN